MIHFNFTPFPQLKTERLILRALNINDAVAIRELRSNPQVNQYLDRPATVTEADALAFINKIMAGISANQSLYWVICSKDDDLLLGTVCLWNLDPENASGETGYELMPVMQGKGFMQEAFSAVLEYSFNTLGLNMITALTMPGNKPSASLLQKKHFIIDEDYKLVSKDETDGNIVYFLLKENWLKLNSTQP